MLLVPAVTASSFHMCAEGWAWWLRTHSMLQVIHGGVPHRTCHIASTMSAYLILQTQGSQPSVTIGLWNYTSDGQEHGPSHAEPNKRSRTLLLVAEQHFQHPKILPRHCSTLPGGVRRCASFTRARPDATEFSIHAGELGLPSGLCNYMC